MMMKMSTIVFMSEDKSNVIIICKILGFSFREGDILEPKLKNTIINS